MLPLHVLRKIESSDTGLAVILGIEARMEPAIKYKRAEKNERRRDFVSLRRSCGRRYPQVVVGRELSVAAK